MHAYIKHGKANIKHFLVDGRVRISLGSYLDHSGIGYDTYSGWRRGDAPGPEATPHVLGARVLDREPLSMSGYSVVDLLSLAQSAAVDIFPVCIRPDLTNAPVSDVAFTFPARARYRSCR